MITYKGKSVSGAIAIGRLYFYRNNAHVIKRRRVSDKEAEKQRFNDARKTAMEQLGVLYEKALAQVGEASAAIFQIHLAMLDDMDYCGAVEGIIDTQSVNAEFAVGMTSDNFSQMFAQMNDEYMRARSADIMDVSERVLKILLGERADIIESDEPVIIVADDLAPSQTVQLDKKKILGFVTFRGSSNSHTAILARTMNLPAVVGTGRIDPSYNGELAVLNSSSGAVIINPDEQTLAKMTALKAENDEKARLLTELKGKPNKTRDGREIKVYANIGSLSDLGSIIKNDAGGIGLFRTEFLYLAGNGYPSEEQQFTVYKQTVEKMAGKHVTIRTLDVGADKTADYFGIGHEDNPALGLRAIRLCLARPEMFTAQLRAIFRASAYGKMSVMYPMITSVEEIRRIKEITSCVKADLRESGIPFDENMPEGIMIETPAAALISDDLTKEADFFSIGTNDLTQYTLAADRQNAGMETFYNPHHKAVLELIRMTAQNAKKAGIRCCICGELAADTSLTEQFILMGVDELSVAPSSVLKLREKICSLDLSGK